MRERERERERERKRDMSGMMTHPQQWTPTRERRRKKREYNKPSYRYKDVPDHLDRVEILLHYY